MYRPNGPHGGLRGYRKVGTRIKTTSQAQTHDRHFHNNFGELASTAKLYQYQSIRSDRGPDAGANLPQGGREMKRAGKKESKKGPRAQPSPAPHPRTPDVPMSSWHSWGWDGHRCSRRSHTRLQEPNALAASPPPPRCPRPSTRGQPPPRIKLCPTKQQLIFWPRSVSLPSTVKEEERRLQQQQRQHRQEQQQLREQQQQHDHHQQQERQQRHQQQIIRRVL